MKVNKFFFSKSILHDITINKYLSKYEYPKFLIRNTLKKASKNFLIDNYSELYEITFKKYIISMRSRLLKIGFSLVKNVFFYRHKNLLFYFSNVGKKKKNISVANLLVNRLNTWSSSNHIVYLYKIRRGGYLGLSKGVIGFVPKAYILVFKDNFIKYKKYILFYNFSGLKSLNCNFSLLKYSKVNILKNFNNSSKKRRQLIFSKLKFILVQCKILIKFWSNFFAQFKFKSITKKKLFLNLVFSKVINACL
jgi:hypothetical protein|tara:strand:+ start:865 stop:1614 length:750 start_codon:yes stop_codon:yes gene_type:complete